MCEVEDIVVSSVSVPYKQVFLKVKVSLLQSRKIGVDGYKHKKESTDKRECVLRV